MSYASATSDLGTLASPDIAINPTSGPPGTNITITISNLPDISKENYPYPELYIYLPFSEPFGVTVPSHCGGEDCFPVYTHDDALSHNIGSRIITLSLFSTGNPKPVYLNGLENSVCDIVESGKIVERFSTLCNTKDEPVGTYQITLVWGLESDTQVTRIAKTLTFIVTPSVTQTPPKAADNGDSVIKQYQNGSISQAQFVNKLKALGWSDEYIRQAMAVIGKLPHQIGGPLPDQTQVQQMLQQPQQNSDLVQKSEQISHGQENIVMQDQAIVQLKNSIPEQVAQQTITATSQNNSWNIITIGASIAAATVIICGILIARKRHKIPNR